MCYSGNLGTPGVPGSSVKYRYCCKSCGAHFNKIIITSDSLLVNLTKSGCPKCSSAEIDFTEYGKLLNDRMLKISKLNSLKNFLI